MRAQAHPIRRAILRVLDRYGGKRRTKLASLVAVELGAEGYDERSLRHHLKQLEGVGLIGFKTDRESRARVKLVYRACDFDVRFKGNGFKIFLRRRAEPRIVL